MKDKTYVCCHSPLISMLLYEATSSDRYKIGFLIGNVQRMVVTMTTDENEAADEEKTVIYVEHCLTLSNETFNSLGEADVNLLQQQILNFKEKIIGVYFFRRNQKLLKCSLRERLIHRWCIENQIQIAEGNFILGLMSSGVRANHGTHSFFHQFFRIGDKRNLEPVRFKVYSLSDTLTNSSGYLKSFALPESNNFQSICASAAARTTCQSETIRTIHSDVHSCLVKIGQKLLGLESKEFELNRDVQALKKGLNLLPTRPEISVPHEVQSNSQVDYARIVRFETDLDYAAGRTLPQLSSNVMDEDFDMDSLIPNSQEGAGDSSFTTSPTPSARTPPGFPRQVQASPPASGLPGYVVGRGRGRGRGSTPVDFFSHKSKSPPPCNDHMTPSANNHEDVFHDACETVPLESPPPENVVSRQPTAPYANSGSVENPEIKGDLNRSLGFLQNSGTGTSHVGWREGAQSDLARGFESQRNETNHAHEDSNANLKQNKPGRPKRGSRANNQSR